MFVGKELPKNVSLVTDKHMTSNGYTSTMLELQRKVQRCFKRSAPKFWTPMQLRAQKKQLVGSSSLTRWVSVESQIVLGVGALETRDLVLG